MFRKNLQIIMLLIITFGVLQLSYADEKIKIRLHQPPPNKLGVGDMWNLELTNTTDKEIKIFLTGTATEEKDGLIIEGKSKVFTVKPGKTSYKYNDFSGAEVKYNNGKYKEIILRTGNAPEGSYTICVTAFDESGTEVGRENCIMQSVQQMGSITLISPEDNAELDPDTLPGIMFAWTPIPNGGPYTLRIVELKGDQSPDIAIKESRPILDKEGITASSIQYSSFGIKFAEGQKYAWQVSSGDSYSEVWAFSMSSATHVSSYLDSVYCTSTPGQYRFKLRVCVDYNNSTFSSATIEPFTFTNNCVPTGVTYAITGLSPILPQTITTPGSGSNCVTFTGFITTTPPSVVTAIEMVSTLRWGSSSYQVTYQPTGVFSALNNCCVPPPPNMVNWWTFDEPIGSTTPNDIRMFNNIGSFVGTPLVIPGMVGNALSFSTGNYVEVPDHPELNFGPCESFSIDCWIRTNPPHTGSPNSTLTILDKREAGSCTSLGYGLYLTWGVIGFQVGSGSTFTNYAANGSTMINDGKWHLVAVTYDRASLTLKLYQDGVVVKTVNALSVPNLNNFATLVIGGRHPNFGGGSFNGDIDELEYFKRALTLTEISSIFNAGSSGKCKQ